MSDARRSQTRAVTAFVAILLAVGATFAACTSYQRQNGEECIKNVDCLSNYCLSQACSPPPPILVGSAYEEAGQSQDSGSGVDSGSGAPDTGTSSDSAGSNADSSGDSSADGPPADSAGEPDASDGQASLGEAQAWRRSRRRRCFGTRCIRRIRTAGAKTPTPMEPTLSFSRAARRAPPEPPCRRVIRNGRRPSHPSVKAPLRRARAPRGAFVPPPLPGAAPLRRRAPRARRRARPDASRSPRFAWAQSTTSWRTPPGG